MRFHTTSTLVAATLAVFALAAAPAARAADVVVLATIAAKSAMEQIAAEFERSGQHKVILRFATANELKGEIEKGVPFDVTLLTNAALDDLDKQGKLAPGSKVPVMRSGVGIAARKGTTNAIATDAELKQALIDARSIVMSSQGATGPIMKRAFERYGIADAVAAKTVLVSNITAAQAVANGQGELGFTQISEVMDTPEARLVGPLPAEAQVFSSFSAAVGKEARNAAGAQAFVGAMSGDAGKAVLKARGLDPQ